MTDLPPGGWYPDPTDSGKERYWDGQQWTEQRRDLPIESQAPEPETIVTAAADGAETVIESPEVLTPDSIPPDLPPAPPVDYVEQFIAAQDVGDNEIWSEPPRPRRAWRGILIGVILVVIALVGGFVLTRADGDPDETTTTTTTQSVATTTASSTTTTTTAPPTTAPPAQSAPDLIGMSEAAAGAILIPLDLTLVISEVETEAASPGEIVGQQPPAGADAPAGTSISVEIAVAPPADCNDIPEQTRATSFTDVLDSGDQASTTAISWAEQIGLIDATSSNFRPNDPLTRGAMVTVLWRFVCQPDADTALFADVPPDAFYVPALNWAAAVGVVGNTGEFNANDAATRAQWATALWRAVGLPEAVAEATYSDLVAEAFYSGAVAWTAELNLIDELFPGLFGPEIAMSRTGAIESLYRLEAGFEPDV